MKKALFAVALAAMALPGHGIVVIVPARVMVAPVRVAPAARPATAAPAKPAQTKPASAQEHPAIPVVIPAMTPATAKCDNERRCEE